MNLKYYLEKHNDGSLTDAEWERLAQQMITEKFDADKKAHWEKMLAEKGVFRQAPKKQLLSVRQGLLILITVAMLSVLLWLLWPNQVYTPAQRIASQYLEHPFRFNVGSSRGNNTNDLNRGRAIEAFDDRQYEKTIQYLQFVETSGEAKAADYFLIGLSQMYQAYPDYRNACTSFEKARRLDSVAYADEINWFSALCFLMVGENLNAENALQRVIDSPSSRNRAEALELMDLLHQQPH